MLAADSGNVSPWTNPSNRFDVNADGRVEPVDLLMLIDSLNRVGARSLIASVQGGGARSLMLSQESAKAQYLDVTGDSEVTPQDALFVVNALNEPPPTAIFRIETLDLAGNPVSSVNQNEAFLIKVIAQDVKTGNTQPQFEDGMFSVYMDVLFNRSLVTPARFQPAADPRPPASLDDAVQFDPAFDIARVGNLDAAIGIDEIGATTQDTVPGQPEQTVFFVAMVPQAQGNVVFTPAFANGLGHDVFVFGDINTPLPANQIDFQASPSLSIIAANPAPKPNITISDVTVTEATTPQTGNVTATFAVTLTNNNYDVQLHFATADGTATNNPPSGPRDYTPTSGILTFAAGGALTQNITVTVRGDTVAEAQENFFVNLFSALNGNITDGQGVGTINDNDGSVPTISIGDAPAQNEGNSPGTTAFTFPVTISLNPTSQATVLFTTGNGSATTADNDYAATSGTLTFSPGGSLTQNVTVIVNGDGKDEDNETFTVTLSGTVNAALNDAQGTTTINDDDAAPTVSIADFQTTEGSTGGTKNFIFPVTLSAASGKQITVAFASAPGGAATPGDYATTNGTLTFAPGVTSQNITVGVVADTTFEPNESFTVTLSNLVNVSAGDLAANITIENDDASPVPAISINDVTTAENVAGGVHTFNVTLSQAGTQQITVAFVTVNGTATTADNDYTATSGTLTFVIGDTSETITVPIIPDTRNEANETYTVVLSGNTGGSTIADGTGLGTISNDDPQPSLSIGDLALAEGNGGATVFNLPVTLSAASGQQVTVAFATSNGTATTADGDYASTNGTLTFAAGEISKNVTVNVTGDLKNEAPETFNVTLTGSVNASIADNLGVGTINNDDAVPNLSINDVTQAEGSSGGTTNFTFTVALSAASGQQVTVPFSTSNGSATAPADYATTTNGTITFNPGEISKPITVAVVADLVDESSTETFNVNLGAAVNANVTDNLGLGTIQDDDGPPGLSIADLSQSETNGATNFNFLVTLPAASSQQITVVYTTSNSSATTADNDYAATVGTLTFAPGDTSEAATVVVNGDTRNEANETFTVTLSAAVNADISDGFATGTIQNDDPQPNLTIGDAPAQGEGNSPGTTAFTFPVNLSAASGQQVTVVFTATNGTATIADSDFATTTGILTFAPGETSKNVIVNVNGDNKNEANETFTVVLSGATNAGIADGTGATTINNDDPQPSLSIAGVSLTEGNAGPKNFPFVVELSAASGQQVTVNFATANNSATAGSDYTATVNALTFAPGETSKTINVAVTGDTTSESNETFTVGLTNAVNAGVTTGTATGEIINDDSPPGISINDVTLTEGNAGTKNFNFTVSLAQASGVPITVEFATTAAGTATAGTDYVATSGTLTFAPNDTSETISVVVNGDQLNEADETFNVTLSNASGSTPISIPTGIGTITNDDVLEISIADASLTEGNAGPSDMSFNVTLGAISAQTVTVVFTTSESPSGDKAASGVDFTSTTGTLTFAPNETSQTVRVPILGDLLDEANETFRVTLSSPTVATIADGAATGTINDDDAPPTVSIADLSQNEGNGGFSTFNNFDFVVTLNTASGREVTANFATANGSASTPADYTATSGVITFAPGETSKTIRVTVRQDRSDESDETFEVNLTGVVNATAGDFQAIGTIVNDDLDGSVDFSTISGSVWVDTDNDGRRDAPEKPLSGVAIKLTGASDASGPIAERTVTTDALGIYKFEEVEPGNYTITEVQPAMYLDGVEKKGSAGGTTPGNDKFVIDVTEGGLEITGYLFAERGFRPEFISQRMAMASSFGAGQGLLSSLNLRQGAAWVSIDNGIDGTLTAEADGSGAGSTTLTLYDGNLHQIATSTGATGDLRVDWNGSPGTPYFVKVTGTNSDVDVRLTNLVSVAGGVVTVHGTDGDDNFTFDASGSVHTFTINGVRYELNPANAGQVVFEGGLGDDHVTLIDSAFDDLLTGEDDWLSLTNGRELELTAFGIESLRAQSRRGDDLADLLNADFELELIGDWA